MKTVADSTTSEHDYRVRRGEISAYGRAVHSSRQLRWLFLAIATVLLGLSIVLWLTFSATRSIPLLPLVLLGLTICAGLWVIHWFVKRHFIEPDLAFRIWLQQVCDGDLDATIDLPKNHRHYKELNFHTLNLASSLRRLSDDMDSLVESQTRRVNDQKRVLELLFKLTTDVAGETEDTAAFETVCHSLAEWFESATVSCYLVPATTTANTIAVNTLASSLPEAVAGDALRCVAVRQSQADTSVIVNKDIRLASELSIENIPQQITSTETETVTGAGVSQRWVPFFAGDEPAGVLIVELPDAEQTLRIETRRVLSTVSEQLSLLCSKKLVQEQILESRLSRDRNELAAEIHDSLAQTLLAVRYQATLLGERLEAQSDSLFYQDVQQIRGSIEEANEEIRVLIREYRYPLSEHRYADLLQQEIEEFSQSNSVPVFFQSDDPQLRFTPREESVLRRIVGESLNNAKKYASASMIRVLMQGTSTGMRRILIEDDGVGFESAESTDSEVPGSSDNGKQIGLSIMRERALSIGAKLVIDSEPGEGTRISITMPPLIESRDVAI